MENENKEIKTTPLHSRHIALGAKMSPFAGFDMPIEYSGIVEEHNAVRNACGVFDVSHMGEVEVIGAEATRFVNRLFTNDVKPIEPGQILYGMMCHPTGGVVDDLLVYKFSDTHYLLVINASNIAKDLVWITAHSAGFAVDVKNRSDETAQIAVQGPESEKVMAEVLGLDCADLKFYTFKEMVWQESPVLVSRTGYTGEDGFEIYGSPEKIAAMWDALIASERVAPCGLGCRDTLRFEVGLPLYGDELADDITPLEAGLGIFVKLDKKSGFIGSDALAAQKAEGPARKLVGLLLEGRAIARHGYEVADAEGNTVGHVTTGYQGISADGSIALALVDAACSAKGTRLEVKIRRKSFPATVTAKKFYKKSYKA